MSSERSPKTPQGPKPGHPSVVYFWGPIRDHVNLVAAEYAHRLNKRPVWLYVRDKSGPGEVPPSGHPIPHRRTFVLKAGSDIQLIPTPKFSPLLAAPSGSPASDIESEVGTILSFPEVVHSALQKTARSKPGGVFVLSNIDRMKHLSSVFEHGMADALVRTFNQHGVSLILTSEGLLPLPHLEYECAFEVNSSPDDAWWEAEVRPGVPVSCCSDCSGSPDGRYATCTPEFRLVCPVLVPLARATA